MKLKELLSIIDREKVFKIAFANMQKDLLFEYKKVDKEKVKLRYFSSICEIKATRNRKTIDGSMVVVKTKDFNGDETYDSYIIKPDDKEHYSISLSPWSEYHSYEIHEKSIERYGAEIVAEAIINDMIFHGFTKKQRDSRRQSITRSLNEALKADPSTFIPSEQVFAELDKKFGLPPREVKTEEQKEAAHQEWNNIIQENYTELDLLEVPYRKE